MIAIQPLLAAAIVTDADGRQSTYAAAVTTTRTGVAL